MRTLIGAALLAMGAVLLVWGIDASDSLGSEISEFFRGSPSDRSMWLILGGIVALAAGLGALFTTRRSIPHGRS